MASKYIESFRNMSDFRLKKSAQIILNSFLAQLQQLEQLVETFAAHLKKLHVVHLELDQLFVAKSCSPLKLY